MDIEMLTLKSYQVVSNPIREYLQMVFATLWLRSNESFKPYKGVSSNRETALFTSVFVAFQTL